MLAVAFLGPLVAAGVSYLGAEAQSRRATSAAKSANKALKARVKEQKLSIMQQYPSKPRGTRSEGMSGSPVIPSAAGEVIPGFSGGMGFNTLQGGAPQQCPGPFSIPIGGQCVDLTALPPGGDPAVTGQVGTGVMLQQPQGMGGLVTGYYGVGVIPRVETRAVRECPSGFKLGKDGVCYEHLSRSQRMWDPGVKPLMTGGDRAAIARAARAAGALERSKKSLKKASRALGKVCG
jgi:hypothetical protein